MTIYCLSTVDLVAISTPNDRLRRGKVGSGLVIVYELEENEEENNIIKSMPEAKDLCLEHCKASVALLT